MDKNINAKEKHTAPGSGAGGSKSGSAPLLITQFRNQNLYVHYYLKQET